MSSAVSPAETTVLVTGGTGFTASYIILRLLSDGFRVHTTVRALSRESKLRATLHAAGAGSAALSPTRLAFFAADLTSDPGWADAVAGCTFVQHIAAPVPLAAPKHPDDVIVPALEGALRVLRFARDSGSVRRVVMTSSQSTITHGHDAPGRSDGSYVFTERDWTVLDTPQGRPLPAYFHGKTRAERAAWEFVEKERDSDGKGNGSGLELATIMPSLILGPVLSADMSPSIEAVKQPLEGKIPMVPNISYSVSDVRDLADLHVRAMLDPKARNERFIGIADGAPLWFREITRVMKEGRPEVTGKVSTRVAPDWLMKVIGFFNPVMRENAVPLLGVMHRESNEKARTLLGWRPRTPEETILDTLDSLVEKGLV